MQVRLKVHSRTQILLYFRLRPSLTSILSTFDPYLVCYDNPNRVRNICV